MRCLIAISSCWDYEKQGFNQAQRETWLPDVAKFPDLDYKFFVGRGQGAEDQEVTGDHRPFGGMVVNQHADTIFLPEIEDDSAHLSYKTRSSLHWAFARDYDFVFRIFPDTYVRVDRLMACGFEQHSYQGDFRGSLAWPGYASGGAGYWLSQEAYVQLLNAPILGMARDDVMMRVEDMWVGLSLKDVTRFDDQRFKNTRDDCPSKENDFVTAHLSYTWQGSHLKAEPYDSAEMFAAHEVWNRS